MKLTEKVSYLKGLMDGLDINESTKEGKVLLQMIDLLEEMALSVEDIQDEIDEVTELIDILDEDLGELENDFYETEDDFDDDFDYDEFDDDDDDYEFDEDEELYEVICPTCGDTICLDEDLLAEGSMDCPNCGENLEFDFDPNSFECDCGDCNDK